MFELSLFLLPLLAEVGAQARSCTKGVNKVFFKMNLGSPGELSGAVSCLLQLFVYILKQVSMYFSCLGPCCFSVKLRKHSVGCETSPDVPSAWGRMGNVWIYIFW